MHQQGSVTTPSLQVLEHRGYSGSPATFDVSLIATLGTPLSDTQAAQLNMYAPLLFRDELIISADGRSIACDLGTFSGEFPREMSAALGAYLAAELGLTSYELIDADSKKRAVPVRPQLVGS